MLRRTEWLPFIALMLVACGDHHGKTLDAGVTSDTGAMPPGDAGPPDGDTTAPDVISTLPAAGDLDVPQSTAISVRFTEPVDPASVTASAISIAGVTGTLTVTGDLVELAPSAPLAAATDYTLVVTTAITDLAGNHLEADRTFHFRTWHTRRVFVTSVSGTARLSTWADAGGHTGLAAGDAICQARADAAHLGGSFVAWLSSSSDDAFCRVQGATGKRTASCGQTSLPASAGPWARVDGQPFAGALLDMLDPAEPRIYSPVVLDELGYPSSTVVWTATAGDGTALADTCGDWEGSTGGASYGGTYETGSTWSAWGTWNCAYSYYASLLCFEVGRGAATTVPAQAGKRAFLTSTVVTGDLGSSPEAGGLTGIAAGDAICQARAAAAGLPPAGFHAWLSTPMVSASARFTSDGPWVRLDGFPVASNKADLLDGILATTLNLTDDGHYLIDAIAWTGTYYNGVGVTAGYDCNDWLGAATYVGYAGHAIDARLRWTQDTYNVPCTTPAHLYCLED